MAIVDLRWLPPICKTDLEEITIPLEYIINQSFVTCVVPDNLNIAKIIMFVKGTRSRKKSFFSRFLFIFWSVSFLVILIYYYYLTVDLYFYTYE